MGGGSPASVFGSFLCIIMKRMGLPPSVECRTVAAGRLTVATTDPLADRKGGTKFFQPPAIVSIFLQRRAASSPRGTLAPSVPADQTAGADRAARSRVVAPA